MKRFSLCTMLVLVLLLLTSCMRALDSGVVIRKEYEPRRTYTTMIRVRMCNMWRWMPTTRTHGPYYWLYVEGTNDAGETITERWSVTDAEYSSVEIGDTVSAK